MANPIDIISKNSSSTSEVSLVSDKEVTKDAPSLFDSLLKDSMGMDKEEEALKQDTLTKKDGLNKETLVVDEVNNKGIEDNEVISLKSANNSLLDRLVIEAKNETAKEQIFDKTLNNEILNEASKNSQNTMLETGLTTSTLDNQDTKIDSQKVSLDESPKNSQDVKVGIKDIKIVEDGNDIKNLTNDNLEVTILTQDNLETKDIKIVEDKNTIKDVIKETLEATIPTPDNQDAKIDSQKVISNESEKDSQEVKIETKDIKIVDNENSVKDSIKNNQDTKLDSQKVILDESEKSAQELKVEIKNIKIVDNENVIKDLNKDIQLLNSSENKEVLAQNSLENIESLVTPNMLDEESKTIDTKESNIIEEAIPSTLKKQIVDLEEEQNVNNKKSLMDLLIDKNSKNSILNVSENETINKTELNQSKDFLSSLYLGGQKNILNSQFLLNKSEAINILKNGNLLADIEKSANILELGLEDLSVEQNVDLKTLELVKKQDMNNIDKKNLLDSLLMEKNIRSEDVKHLITKSIEASNALLENSLNIAEDIELSVNSPLSYNIQSRIIGAKQQMSTMMSDIARQMYENYRPPVTVFRINLNPLELGSIAILMKNDKNSNALTISMNASNGGTLEALVENQNVLRNSLNKTFDENTIFNLDFTSSNQNNQQSSNGQSNSNQQNRFEGQIDTQSVLQLKEENKDREDKVLDYM